MFIHHKKYAEIGGDFIKILMLSGYMFFAGVMLFCTGLIINKPGTGWMLVISMILIFLGLILLAAADTKE